MPKLYNKIELMHMKSTKTKHLSNLPTSIILVILRFLSLNEEFRPYNRLSSYYEWTRHHHCSDMLLPAESLTATIKLVSAFVKRIYQCGGCCICWAGGKRELSPQRFVNYEHRFSAYRKKLTRTTAPSSHNCPRWRTGHSSNECWSNVPTYRTHCARGNCAWNGPRG